MDPTQLTDDQLDDLATQLAPRLPTGTHGDRVILSRRQFAAAASGTLGAGALAALGVDEASAQAAGQQGTASSPNDMFAYNLDVENGATFNGTDISGVGSLSTDSQTIAVDATRTLADGQSADNPTTYQNSSGKDIFESHFSGEVSTSVVDMVDASLMGDVVVMGFNSSTTNIRFVERVTHLGPIGGPVTQYSHSSNSPAARSYEVNNGNLGLSMASGTYVVVAKGWAMK